MCVYIYIYTRSSAYSGAICSSGLVPNLITATSTLQAAADWSQVRKTAALDNRGFVISVLGVSDLGFRVLGFWGCGVWGLGVLGVVVGAFRALWVSKIYYSTPTLHFQVMI